MDAGHKDHARMNAGLEPQHAKPTAYAEAKSTIAATKKAKKKPLSSILVAPSLFVSRNHVMSPV
jgi:hypothetical protein